MTAMQTKMKESISDMIDILDEGAKSFSSPTEKAHYALNTICNLLAHFLSQGIPNKPMTDDMILEEAIENLKRMYQFHLKNKGN